MGLPVGVPDAVRDLAWARYLIVSLAILWAGLHARARPVWSGLAAVVFTSVGLGFWVFALARPYGLFVEAGATRRAAEASVMATSGNPREGILAAGPPAQASILGRIGLPARVAIVLPTLLPLLVLPLVAAVIRVGWGDRRRAAVAGLLWLAFSTGDLDGVGGAGFISGAWAHPESSLAFVGIVLAALLLGRLPVRPAAALGLACLPMAAWFVVPPGSPALAPADAVLLLTVDQGLWLLLGSAGLMRGRGPSSRALTVGGAVVVMATAAGAPADLWGAYACFRVGLILAAAGPCVELATQVGAYLARAPRLFGPVPADRAGVALVLLLALPGSFLVWWDPTRLDPVARDSVEPLSPVVAQTMDWISRETPRDAVFVASAEYAPHVAVLAGRRVLRAPSLVTAPDDGLRLRVERMVLSGRFEGDLRDRYHVTHVFVAPGDFRARGVRGPEDLGLHDGLRLRYSDEHGLTVYEVVRP